jgi:hypothetical protein
MSGVGLHQYGSKLYDGPDPRQKCEESPQEH